MYNEYQKINNSIKEVKYLFVGISRLLVEQQPIIVEIGEKIDNSNNLLKDGNEEIIKTIPKNSMNFYCWVGFLVLIILFSVIVIIMIKIKRG